jgi:HlyD family secretion protein
MKKKLIFVVLGVAMAALLFWAFSPSPAEVEVATVIQGRFERMVQEDGKTRLRERFVVSTPLAGNVARIALKQGDSVQRDAVVATLWAVSPALLDERTREEQVARIGAAEATVARAKANAERAAAALDQARAELKRSAALAQKGFVSPTQNETDELKVRLREKELEGARQEEDASRHALDQTRIALRQYAQPASAKTSGAYAIKAPVSGKVLKVMQQSEAIVQAGTPLMEIGDSQRLEVVADVLTEDAAQIHPGAEVQLANWGGAITLTGVVRLVEPAAFTKVSALGVEEQRVNVVIDITTPLAAWTALGDAFKVDVRVLVQIVDNAIQVPVSALFPVGSRSGLFVLEGGHARLQEVDVSSRNGVTAWIKTGLTPGMQVIVYPDTKLKDAEEVKVR